jgi:tetratricopeptide (TPR) repeat protein
MPGAGGVITFVFGIAFLACMAALLLKRIFGWYMDGEISGLLFIVISGVFLGSMSLMFTLPSVWLRVFLALTLAGFVIAAPFLQKKFLHDPDLRSFHDERIEQYRQAVADRPDNLAARRLLAEELYRRGLLDEAIETLSELVEIKPSLEESKRLQSFIRERDERKTRMRECPGCGHSNPIDRAICESCGGETSMSRAIAKSIGVADAKRILIASGITLAVVTVLLVFFGLLTPAFRIVAVCFVVLFVLVAALVRLYMQY